MMVMEELYKKSPQRYSELAKKVVDTTLTNALHDLIKQKLVEPVVSVEGRQRKVVYQLTGRGRKMVELAREMRRL